MTTTELPEFPMARAAECPFDPPPEARHKQQEAPLTRGRLWDGSTPWLVTRYAEQRQLMADPRISADIRNPGYPSPAATDGEGSKISFILMDDPEHARLRRMVTAPFTAKRIAAMRPAVQKIVDEQIDQMLAGPTPVDLVEAFALPVPSLVICELLGVPYAGHDFFQENTKKLIKRPVDGERVAPEALGNLTAYLTRLMESKIADPQDDLLSGLADRVTAGELSTAEAAQMGVLLLIAGHETTANMIALGTLALLEHPTQLEKLRTTDDPAVVRSAVEELLRYLNITHSGRRRVATEDIDIAGVTIAAGEGVIMANDLANRDEQVFGRSDDLDVERNPRSHIAFGYGVHQCLGQSLARLELEVVYGTLYRRIPTLQAAEPIENIPFKHDGSVYGVYELPVTW